VQETGQGKFLMNIDFLQKMNFNDHCNSFGKETHTAVHFRAFANMRDLAKRLILAPKVRINTFGHRSTTPYIDKAV
jgi:hypothetical protein